ncbi:MAG: hypothetical protein R2710_07975 [Acidimicrobiales bacterium]
MTTRRPIAVTIAAVLALVATACSGGSDATIDANAVTTTSLATTSSSEAVESSTTSSTEGTTTTTAETTTTTASTNTASTATTEAVDEYVLALAPEGLMVVEAGTGSTNMLAFDSAQSIVVNAVTDLLGPASNQGPGSSECGNGQDFVATWDGQIMLEFADGAFIGWSTRPGSTLTDLAGIGWGTSLATLRNHWAVTVEESTLGTEFSTSTDGAGYHGLLSDDTDAALIEDLWAGSICTFR